MMVRALVGASVLGAVSCAPGDERMVRRALAEHIEAWRYEDVDGALAVHVDASPRGEYCTSEAFMKILLDVRRVAPEPGGEVCAAAARVTESGEGAADETVLLAQVTRHVCETPDAGCIGYQERVAKAQIAGSARWGDPPERAEVRSVRVEGDEASARVEFMYAAGRTERRTVKVVRVMGTWRVVDRMWLEDAR